MSEVARRIEGERQNEILHSIAEISRSSVSSMSDIVWAINPQKDSFLELVRRMRSFAEEILGQKEINLVFNVPEFAGELKLDADIRRNIFLIFKESINNTVRHSRAEKVEIELDVLKNILILTIKDNGAGFETTRNCEGNGLTNMKRRAADLKGKLQILSEKEKGTEIVLEVPLERKF